MQKPQRELQRSAAVRGAVILLSRLESALPTEAYRLISDTVFSVYRRAIRIAYLRHMVAPTRLVDSGARRLTRLVFRVMPYSLVGWRGLEATGSILQLLNRNRVEGAIVECGVARGGSAALLSLLNRESPVSRHVWLFDSFEGLPDPTAEDFAGGKTGSHLRPLPRGSCLGTYSEVQALLFGRFGLDPADISLVRGWFKDTLPASRRSIGQIALLRLDGDWYESTKCCLENLFDSVTPGGYLIIDDYESCYGAQKAVDEFLSARNVAVSMTYDGRGGSFFVKPVAAPAVYSNEAAV